MKTLFLSQMNTIKTFLVKISMRKSLQIYHNQHNIFMAISVQKYCKFIDWHPLHIFVQKMDCLRAKKLKKTWKLNSLRAKNMKNYEKLNSLRAKWCSAHCPRHCHCSCTNCCGCCSNAFDNINDMQSLWNSDKNISKLQGRYESKFAKLRKHASRVYFAKIHFW